MWIKRDHHKQYGQNQFQGKGEDTQESELKIDLCCHCQDPRRQLFSSEENNEQLLQEYHWQQQIYWQEHKHGEEGITENTIQGC